MPITQERQTIQDLRAAGFSQQQAEVLAAKYEEAAQATTQDLKPFISADSDRRFAALGAELERRFAAQDRKLDAMEGRVDVKFAQMGARLETLRADFQAALRDQTFKLIATLVAAISLAVAIIKIFPNAN